MATSNQDRIDRGMILLAAGLAPFVDAAMSAAAPAGRDWVDMLQARDNSRHGTDLHYSRWVSGRVEEGPGEDPERLACGGACPQAEH
ncbi:MAG: hypothetical protein ACRDOH_09735 [Streptosporangiaceae bacterium]